MVLGIDEKIWLDSTKINVISGKAGCSKSGDTHAFYEGANKKMLWLTSTHFLAKVAEERFGHKCYTIAGGAFVTVGGVYYKEFKDIDADVVVMDEVLQADIKRVVDFCNENVGKVKIVLLTDVHQMLTPDEEFDTLNVFNKFIQQDNVVFSEITYTKRADDDETREAYNYYYNLDGDMPISVSEIKKKYKTIDYSQMSYNYTDKYIVHTNDQEEFMYLDKNLASLRDAPVIPKGGIAGRKNPNRDVYPVLPQNIVKKNKRYERKGYFQLANIATPTRFQGSEAKAGETLYYIISDKSGISAREFYTVITRLHRIQDLVIVICNEVPEKVEHLKTFRGLPVKREKYLSIPHEGETKTLTAAAMNEFFEKNYPDTDDICYNKDIVYAEKSGKGNIKMIAMMKKGAKQPQGSMCVVNGLGKVEPFRSTQVNIQSVSRRDGALQYSYVPEIYEILDKEGLKGVAVPRLAKGTNNLSGKYKYDVDLSGAYPLFLNYFEVPIEGLLSRKPSKNMLNFYLYKGKTFTNNSLINNEKLIEQIKNENLGEVKYLFSLPKKIGCIPGEYALKEYHKSAEAKDKCKKNMLWGIWEKEFLQLNKDCYIMQESHIYKILMATIYSQQSYYMYNLCKALNEHNHCVDAVYLEKEPDDNTVKIVESVLPECIEYKIENLTYDKNDKRRIIYRRGVELKSESEIKRDKMRAKRAAMTEEEKEAQRAKDRERKRLAKQEQS